MKAIIILSLSAIAQTAFSQQQQQIQQRNVMITNISNVNYLNNNVIVQASFNNEQKQQVIKNVARVSPTRRYTQVKTTTTAAKNPAPQVRRRARPRTVNTTPRIVTQPKVDPINNVFEANEMINASNVNVPAQNFILPVNSDIQSQSFSNVAEEGSNPFVQQETNKVELDLNIDLSLNLKGKTTIRSRASSSSSSSSHSRSHAFNKKMAKFKRHFFGKLSSHTKGKHRLDLCFNWKN